MASAALCLLRGRGKQISCPHCGFDATWYKRDVKVARQLVKDFWVQKQGLDAQNSQPAAKQS